MTEPKNKKILVTGGTGLLGSYLLRYLVDRSYTNVFALRRKQSSQVLVHPVADRINWVEGDVLDIFDLEEAMEGVHQVYHCAAMVSFQSKVSKEMMHTNKIGTENVVNTALHTGVEKLLHVSSVATLGREKHVRTFNETHKWVPGQSYSNYALSKYLAEQEVWRAHAEGLPIVVVNPSVILGSAYWDRGPQQLFTKIWNGLAYYPQGITGFVDVRDVARFMIRLMESEIVGERYIVNSENESFREIIGQIAVALGKSPPTRLLSPPWTSLFWRIEKLRAMLSGRAPLITRESTRLASASSYYDNQKSITDLDFDYTPINQTIVEMGQQFLEAAQNGLSPRILPLVK